MLSAVTLQVQGDKGNLNHEEAQYSIQSKQQ